MSAQPALKDGLPPNLLLLPTGRECGASSGAVVRPRQSKALGSLDGHEYR